MKLIFDFIPLAVFFVGYKLGGLMEATAALMVATLCSLALSFILYRKIALNPLISGIVIAIFGGLTLALENNTFIKMKPTLVNLIFALVLIGGLLLRKPLLKSLLASAIELSDTGWKLLTLRWAIFFIFLAGLNECIWRNFPEEFWVNFKVFGMLPITLLFMACQYPLIKKYSANINH